MSNCSKHTLCASLCGYSNWDGNQQWLDNIIIIFIEVASVGLAPGLQVRHSRDHNCTQCQQSKYKGGESAWDSCQAFVTSFSLVNAENKLKNTHIRVCHVAGLTSSLSLPMSWQLYTCVNSSASIHTHIQKHTSIGHTLYVWTQYNELEVTNENILRAYTLYLNLVERAWRVCLCPIDCVQD